MSVSELSVALLALLTGLSFTAVSPVLPLYVQDFGISYEALGLFFSAYSLTWGLLQLYTGYLSDRYGRRRLALIGLAIYSLSAIGCAQAQSFTQLLLFRVLQGAGLGLLGPALLGLAAGLQRRGRGFAVFRTAQVLGEVIGPVIGGYVGQFGLGKPFLLSAGAGGLGIVTVLLVREKGDQRGAAPGFWTVSRDIFTERSFLLVCVGTFLAEMGYVARGVTVPLVGEAAGLTTRQIGLLLGTYSLVFVLSQVPIGILAERMSRKRLLVGCALVGALGFGGLFLSTSLWHMALAMGILGLTLGTIFVQSTAWVAELAPDGRRSQYLASFDASIDLSFSFTPLLVGPLAGLGLRLPFLLCVLLLLASAWTLSRVRDREQRDEVRSPPGGL